MKKILIFHHYNTCVGAGLCLFQIAISLKSKFDVVVCLPQLKGDLNKRLIANGIKTINLEGVPKSYSHYNGAYKPFFSRQHIKDIFLIRRNKNKIKEILKSENPDSIMVNSMTLFWIGKIAKKFGVRSYCYVRETYCNTKFNIRTNYIKKCINKYFDKVIFISKFDMDSTGENIEKYTLITDKVDFSLYDKLNKADARRQLHLPKSKKIILYVGGDNPIKGPMVILKALKQLTNNAILVYLQHNIIRNDFKTKLRRLMGKDITFNVEKYIDKNKLNNKVILRPATNEVEKYFVASDIVVFPNTVAHQARPIYEAGYTKIPIVATDYEHIKEFLNADTGFVFEKNNFKQLANIIDEIFDEKIDISLKIKNNYKQTVENHNYKTLGDEIINVIEKR